MGICTLNETPSFLGLTSTREQAPYSTNGFPISSNNSCGRSNRFTLMVSEFFKMTSFGMKKDDSGLVQSIPSADSSTANPGSLPVMFPVKSLKTA